MYVMENNDNPNLLSVDKASLKKEEIIKSPTGLGASAGGGNARLPAVLICDCNSIEHQIVIHPEDEDGLVYCHINLIHYGFWRRLKAGLKYIFGYKSRYGQWDESSFANCRSCCQGIAANGRVLGEGWALVAQNFKISTDVK